MFRSLGGAIGLVVGGMVILRSVGGRSINFTLFLIGAGCVYVGLQWFRGRRLTDSPVGAPVAKRPSVPADFQMTYWNRNIALDGATGSLWVKDQSGSTAVLRKDEVAGWESVSDSSNHQTLIGPRTVHLQNRLLVKTRNPAKPVWTIRFNAHPERTMGGSQANHNELSEWAARMAAVYQRIVGWFRKRTQLSTVFDSVTLFHFVWIREALCA